MPKIMSILNALCPACREHFEAWRFLIENWLADLITMIPKRKNLRILRKMQAVGVLLQSLLHPLLIRVTGCGQIADYYLVNQHIRQKKMVRIRGLEYKYQ